MLNSKFSLSFSPSLTEVIITSTNEHRLQKAEAAAAAAEEEEAGAEVQKNQWSI